MTGQDTAKEGLSMSSHNVQKLDTYLRKHQNRRTGKVIMDYVKIEQETGLTVQDVQQAVQELARQMPRKWGFRR